MSQIQIYLDEDAMDSDLAAALRSRGVAVFTALESGLVGEPDDKQLAFATRRGCVLYTFNVSDFYRLHTQVGEQLRRILRLRAAVTTGSMRNQVEFLANWG